MRHEFDQPTLRAGIDDGDPMPATLGKPGTSGRLNLWAMAPLVGALYAVNAHADAPDASTPLVSGYVDAAYEHFEGQPFLSSGSPTAPAPARTFDVASDTLTLHQAALILAYQPKEGFGGVLNLIGGRDPDVFAPYDINPGTHRNFDYPQAYVQYAHGSATIIAGRFVTLAGAETIDPRTDSNFSRSLLFGYAIPFGHTGVRATVAANDQLSLTLGVVNGWDDLKDTNSAKTAELGATYTPTKSLSLVATGYFGQERVGGLVGAGPQGMRDLIDLVGTWTIDDTWAVTLNYDWGRQSGAANSGFTVDNADMARWSGLAAYLTSTISEHWHATLRAEYFDDPDGYRTGLMQTWHEVTLSMDYSPVKAVDLRLEGRRDGSNSSAFVANSSAYSPITRYSGTQDHLGSLAVELIYKF